MALAAFKLSRRSATNNVIKGKPPRGLTPEVHSEQKGNAKHARVDVGVQFEMTCLSIGGRFSP